MAAAPEDGAIEEGDEQRHEHAHEVVGGAAPVRQPELARQRHELGQARGRILPRHLQLHRQGCKVIPLQFKPANIAQTVWMPAL